MPISTATNYLISVFNNTYFFGSEYIIQIMIILMTIILVTRQKEDWKIIAFPACTLWMIMGLHINFTIFLITIFLFVMESLSLRTIGEAISGIGKLGDISERAMRTITLSRTPKGKALLKREKEAISYQRKLASQERRLGKSMPELLKQYGKDHALTAKQLMGIGKAESKKSLTEAEMNILKFRQRKAELLKERRRKAPFLIGEKHAQSFPKRDFVQELIEKRKPLLYKIEPRLIEEKKKKRRLE